MLNAPKRWRFLYQDGTLALIQRLLRDYGARYWTRCATAAVWLAVGAVCVAACAYLLGTTINEAYVNRNFLGVAAVASGAIVQFSLKRFARSRR
jgi:hypothetical protein